MSTPAWETDRPLSLDTARAVVRSAFASLDADSLRPLGSGWEFDAFVTGDGWVVRFPRRADAEPLFARERPILELARSLLPASVEVPRVQVADRPADGFPYRIAAHPFLGGIPSDRVGASLRPTLARSLGEALGALHSAPEAAARAAGLAELDRAKAGRIAWFENGSAGVRALGPAGVGLEEAVAWLSELDDPLRRLDAPARLIHQDLSPEHLLADPATGRLVGIIDWTDAHLGDPARDFVPLVTFGGWRFTDEVLKYYTGEVDEGFRARLRFMARLLPLMWLGHAHVRGEDVRRHTTWVQNAFAEPQR